MIHKRRIVMLSGLFLLFFLMAGSTQAFAGDPLTVLDSYIAGWNSHDATQCSDHFAKDIIF